MKQSVIKNQKGQGLVEYLILVAIVALGSMAIVQVMGKNLNSRWASVAAVLSGQSEKKFDSDKVDERYTNKTDLGNFMLHPGHRK